MTEVEIQRIGPDEWEVFRDLRLRALREAPYAFGSRYDDWAQAPEERWRDRLANVPLNLVARMDGELVGMASGVARGRGRGRADLDVGRSGRPRVRGRGTR